MQRKRVRVPDLVGLDPPRSRLRTLLLSQLEAAHQRCRGALPRLVQSPCRWPQEGCQQLLLTRLGWRKSRSEHSFLSNLFKTNRFPDQKTFIIPKLYKTGQFFDVNQGKLMKIPNRGNFPMNIVAELRRKMQFFTFS